jgi:hypothetical protein
MSAHAALYARPVMVDLSGGVDVEAQVTRVPSPEEIMAAKQPNGYWPVEKLIGWGVPTDPPPARWRETLERAWHQENVPDEVRTLLHQAGYDDEGIETAWRGHWHGLGRMRMFEEWWKDPDNVLNVLRREIRETVLVHPTGGEVVLRFPMEAKLAGKTLKALGKLGWEPR